MGYEKQIQHRATWTPEEREGSKPWAGLTLKDSFPPDGVWSFKWVKKPSDVPKEVEAAYYRDRQFFYHTVGTGGMTMCQRVTADAPLMVPFSAQHGPGWERFVGWWRLLGHVVALPIGVEDGAVGHLILPAASVQW